MRKYLFYHSRAMTFDKRPPRRKRGEIACRAVCAAPIATRAHAFAKHTLRWAQESRSRGFLRRAASSRERRQGCSLLMSAVKMFREMLLERLFFPRRQVCFGTTRNAIREKNNACAERAGFFEHNLAGAFPKEFALIFIAQ